MERINIYLLNLGHEAATSGVDRYLNVLSDEIGPYTGEIRVYKIQLIKTASRIFYEQEEKTHYTEITIPFPLDSNEVIRERYWMRKYNQHIFRMIEPLFDKESLSILHLHTLNLIDLALYIKSQVRCKIITHLHCIPWKNSFNSNKKRFNRLYTESYLLREKKIEKEAFITNNCELDSYYTPDKIIAVTRCAKDFLQNTMKVPPAKIHIIPNGLFDCNENSGNRKLPKNKYEVFQCLYVGVLSESKGIFYILDALRIVSSKGYKVNLNVAGSYSGEAKRKIDSNYAGLSVNLLGRISFDELKEQYLKNDMGIIASLQEQCSYAAIEMAMFGLPVITTAVDGLDEMFEDETNALKVNTVFSNVFGLKVDTDMLADNIIRLIENEELRIELGKNVRKLYEEKFTSERMIRETISIYKELYYE